MLTLLFYSPYSKIQEEGLRTYFFTFAAHYDTLVLADLSKMFELPVSTVYSTVAKMIMNEELHASLDQHSATVILHRTGPGEQTRLEYLSNAYADKITGFIENNEKLLEARSQMLGLQQGYRSNEKSEGGRIGGGDSSGRVSNVGGSRSTNTRGGSSRGGSSRSGGGRSGRGRNA